MRFMKPMAIEISATNSKKALTPAVSALPAMPAMPTGPERFSVLTLRGDSGGMAPAGHRDTHAMHRVQLSSPAGCTSTRLAGR